MTHHNDYDPMGRLARQRVYKTHQRHHDVINRSYRYNTQDQVISQQDQHRGSRHYQYSLRDQLIGITQQRPSQPPEQAAHYTFDPAGQLIDLVEAAPRTHSGLDIQPKSTQWSAMPDKARQAHQTEQSQTPHAETSPVSQGRLLRQSDKHYQFDASGNRTDQWRGKGQCIHTHYRYNATNTLQEVVETTDQLETRATFTYDALGRRISKEVRQTQRPSGRLKAHYRHGFLWQGDVLLQEKRTRLWAEENDFSAFEDSQRFDNTHKPQPSVELYRTLYLHEPNSFRPLLQLHQPAMKAEKVLYYHLDRVGTPLELTNRYGDVVWQAHYRGFCRAKVVNEPEVHNPIRFQGQYADEELGLHYNRFRYYDPASGQFTQQDPIGLAAVPRICMNTPATRWAGLIRWGSMK
ncbi:MAG: hypothetical protein HC848_06225 [Limnobacter sp.]|nr:hypothetical protein [Limnobacter sp.]